VAPSTDRGSSRYGCALAAAFPRPPRHRCLVVVVLTHIAEARHSGLVEARRVWCRGTTGRKYVEIILLLLNIHPVLEHIIRPAN
jgi:hypothetical protein